MADRVTGSWRLGRPDRVTEPWNIDRPDRVTEPWDLDTPDSVIDSLNLGTPDRVTDPRIKRVEVTMNDLSGLLKETNSNLQTLIDITNNPKRATLGPAQGAVRLVRIDTADTVKSGPDIPIPPGFNVTVVQRRHTGTHTGYVAFTELEAKNAMERHEMRDADAWSAQVDNMNELFFNAGSIPSGGLFFELIAQR